MVVSHARHTNFSRTVWTTELAKVPAAKLMECQRREAVGPGITTRSRGRWAGKRGLCPTVWCSGVIRGSPE